MAEKGGATNSASCLSNTERGEVASSRAEGSWRRRDSPRWDVPSNGLKPDCHFEVVCKNSARKRGSPPAGTEDAEALNAPTPILWAKTETEPLKGHQPAAATNLSLLPPRTSITYRILAVCTDQGGLLSWNDTETFGDCPCTFHASRLKDDALQSPSARGRPKGRAAVQSPVVGGLFAKSFWDWEVHRVFACPGEGINAIVAAFGKARNQLAIGRSGPSGKIFS